MIAHTSLNVSNIDKSKAFYLQALAPMGYKVAHEYPQYEVYGFMSGEGLSDFWINGKKGKGVEKTHIAFGAQNAEQVQRFHEAALKAGAKNNGAPGYRADYGAGYYAAYVHDPDGHNIEVMWWDAPK